MFEIISFISLLGSSTVLSAGPVPLRLPERAVRLFVCFAFLCISSGWLVSLAGQLNNIIWWASLHAACFVLAIGYYWFANKRWPVDVTSVVLPDVQAWRSEFGVLSWWLKVGVVVLASALVLTLTLTAIVAILAAPHNWDSLSYHLARMAYYLQQGNLDRYGANYFAQEIYPKSSTILKAYAFLVTGRNENFTQFVQYAAYMATLSAVYGASRILGAGRIASAIGAITFGLLPNVLMQSTTTQDDLLMTSLGISAIYLLLCMKQEPRIATLWLAAFAAAMMVGTKFSFSILAPAIALTALYVLPAILTVLGNSLPRRILTGALIAAVGLNIILSLGYADNILHYGSPLGPEAALSRLSQSGDIGPRVVETGKNAFRYLADAWSLEGIPDSQLTLFAQKAMRFPLKVLALFGLEDTLGPVGGFSIYRGLVAHEDLSSPGLVGLVFFVPAIVLGVANIRRNPVAGGLACAAIFGFVFLCWQTYYDPWQGRRLVAIFAIAGPLASLFAAKLLAMSSEPTRSATVWSLSGAFLAAVIGYAGIAGSAAIIFRTNSNLLPVANSLFYRDGIYILNDRIAMLTRNWRPAYETISRFEELVPSHAIVAVAFTDDEFEYALFGEKFTRTIQPIRPFDRNLDADDRPYLLPVPEEADFLLYEKQFYEPEVGDVDLGSEWYLRRLKTGGDTAR